MSFANIKANLTPAIQAIVKQFSTMTECAGDQSCRCDRCKITLARYPSRKLAREGSSYTKFAFPLVRRNFPPQLGPSLTSIQPMSLPSGKVFYIDYAQGAQDGSSEDEGDDET